MDDDTRSAIDARLARFRGGNFGDSESIGGGASENKIDFGPGYRIYYGIAGSNVVVLCAGDKSTQTVDIKRAKKYWTDYKNREKERKAAEAKKALKNADELQKDLLSDLKNRPGYAAKYLTAAAADSAEAFLVALRDVGSARKGMTRLAAAAEVNRVNLYQMLSKKGNPGIRNIRAICDALQLEIRVFDKHSEPANAPIPHPQTITSLNDPREVVLWADLTKECSPGMTSSRATLDYNFASQKYRPVGSPLGLGLNRRSSSELGTALYLHPWANPSPSHLAVNP